MAVGGDTTFKFPETISSLSPGGGCSGFLLVRLFIAAGGRKTNCGGGFAVRDLGVQAFFE